MTAIAVWYSETTFLVQTQRVLATLVRETVTSETGEAISAMEAVATAAVTGSRASTDVGARAAAAADADTEDAADWVAAVAGAVDAKEPRKATIRNSITANLPCFLIKRGAFISCTFFPR
jgi:hypothetical protein